jgi:hypothetical protein
LLCWQSVFLQMPWWERRSFPHLKDIFIEWI